MSHPAPAIHWARPCQPRPITHVVFDFDGTISWLRHGWPDMMVEVLREALPAKLIASYVGLDEQLMSDIIRLNGKPTIFQMLQFVDWAAKQGVPGLDAEALRVEYQRRLDAAIDERIANMRAGRCECDAYVVHGARKLLEHLAHVGLKSMILSSTVQDRVRQETEWLGLGPFFGEHVYGGTGDPIQFSKRAVFERILSSEQITGEQLLAIGDGPVEIADAKHLGASAVALCSDERVNGSGLCDEHKLQQLMAAGADAAIADFRDAIELIDLLRGAPR